MRIPFEVFGNVKIILNNPNPAFEPLTFAKPSCLLILEYFDFVYIFFEHF